jgi:hypothetical protein
MGEELTEQNLRLPRREGGVSPAARALPTLDPAKPAKWFPFRPVLTLAQATESPENETLHRNTVISCFLTNISRPM